MTTLLDLEIYDENLAASVLRVSKTTLHSWLEGSTRNGHQAPPIIRAEATGNQVVTWGEFVEAYYIREYRRTHKVPMTTLRKFVDYLRDNMHVAYPLAHSQPWVGPGRRLLIEAQEYSNLKPEQQVCFEPTSGQLVLGSPGDFFLERVEFGGTANDIAIRIWPEGKDQPIVMDPKVKFGMPTIRGVPTEALAEQYAAGDAIETLVEDFELTTREVIIALHFEPTDYKLAC